MLARSRSSRPRRLAFGAAFALFFPTLLFIASPACDGDVIVPGEGGGGQGGEDPTRFTTRASTGARIDGGQDAFPDYTDPGCPNKPPPIYDLQCDPYQQGNGDCFFDEGCYIYVEYPPDPCGQEVYGAVCVPAGTGQQGDPCGGPQSCGPGLACVITGSGTQCVTLCPLEGADNCPQGMVCEPIDVEGFGGCL